MINYETKTTWVENWYEISQLKNGVVAIGEPKHQEEVFCYLVKGEKKDLLIDTGMGILPITQVLEKVRNSARELIVVNTHWHFDHVGGNNQFKTVFVPNNTDEVRGLLRGWSWEDLEKYGFFDGFYNNDDSTVPPDFDLEHFFLPGSKNIEPVLKDGYIIDLGGKTLEIIETPGHTPGGISLFEHANGLLFTSDLLYEGPLYAFEPESDPKIYLRSLEKIKRKFGGSLITTHPGHNYPENWYEQNLLEDAIELFRMAKRKVTPDDNSSNFPEAVEYIYPGMSRRTNGLRRLKVLVNKNFLIK